MQAGKLLPLLAVSPFDARRVLVIGRSLLADGGIEAVEAMIDIVLDRLGMEVAAELVILWTPIVEGGDRTA